jgi:hypothetical protein
LRKGLRPLLSGKPDEVVRQGSKVAVLDHKYGNYRVDDPRNNVQLSLYALLVAHSDVTVEQVTCQILSPLYDFEFVTSSREELDELYKTVLVVVASLADPGDHCHFLYSPLNLSSRKRPGRPSDAGQGGRASLGRTGRSAVGRQQTGTGRFLRRSNPIARRNARSRPRLGLGAR